MAKQYVIPEFCIQVRAACLRERIDQDELADLCGCTRQYMNMFLNGRKNVPKIAEKLRERFPEITVPYKYESVA